MGDRSASMFEIKALKAPQERYDVVIMGGGLAGLTLGLQLKQTRPETSVLIAEKRQEPAPLSTFKVGESTSEVGAHYYKEVLGLREHMLEDQLRKKGLRFFVTAGDNSDITRRVEFATPRRPSAYTFQIDRGLFENELYDRCVKAGVDIFRDCRVQDVEFGSDEHRVTIEQETGEFTVAGRWVVDATGRRNLLRRKLNLGTETDHHINAAWFRLDGGLDVEDWSDDEEWLARTEEPGIRKHATIHLSGTGYWVWMIQLSTGPISIGLVADPRFHPFEEFNEFDRLVEWFKRHEPQLAAAVDPRRDDVMDFLVIEDFSYGCERVFSTDRWALTGEAAGFVDPLYSPGSDFIGYLNCFINDLVRRDLEGEDIEERLEFFNFFFFQIFDPTILLYRDGYKLLGNPQVLLGKLLYDSTAYFSTLAFLFIHGKMINLEDLAEIVEILETVIPLLGRMQELVRDWHELDNREYQGVSVLNHEFKMMGQRLDELGADYDQSELIEITKEHVEGMKAIALWLFHQGAKHLPEPPDPEARINPLAVSLRPEKWEEEGLFSEDGWTLAEAIERAPGIEEYALEARGAAVA